MNALSAKEPCRICLISEMIGSEPTFKEGFMGTVLSAKGASSGTHSVLSNAVEKIPWKDMYIPPSQTKIDKFDPATNMHISTDEHIEVQFHNILFSLPFNNCCTLKVSFDDVYPCSRFEIN
jgi:hypothetical protein